MNDWHNEKIVSAGGFEPPTLCLKGRCSTTELRALKIKNYKYINLDFLFQTQLKAIINYE